MHTCICVPVCVHMCVLNCEFFSMVQFYNVCVQFWGSTILQSRWIMLASVRVSESRKMRASTYSF